VPGIWEPRQLGLVRAAAVEPDDGRHQHLPHGRQGLVSAPPIGHRGIVALVGAVVEVVDPARAHVDAVNAQTHVAQEERVELVAGDDIEEPACHAPA
jgi:hypothetical protein